jgi:hypothetical protein
VLRLLELTSRAVADICGAEDKHKLHEAMRRSVQLLGFDSFNLGCEKSAKREFMTDPTLTNWSYDDLVAYERDGWSDRDPLLDYAATASHPLYWKSSDWQNRPKSEYREYLEWAGISSGITVPLPELSGGIGALTLLS